MIKIVAGLGNPDAEYQKTRHNIGFMVMDNLAGAGAKWSNNGGALLSELHFDSEKVILVKPNTFMNRSGEPLQSVMGYYKVGVSELVVVHDEIDIEFGKIRIRQGGGEGGHNGIRSVVASLGNSDFTRIRVGIGRPSDSRFEVADWVLSSFSKEEFCEVPAIVERASQAVAVLIKEGLVIAQQRYSN